MDTVLENGVGNSNYKARVDAKGRLYGLSIAQGQTAAASLEEQSCFMWETGVITLIGSTLTSVLWLRNDDPSRFLLINKFTVCWNGGNANRNRGINGIVFANTGEPNANHVLFPAGNMFLGASKQAVTTSYRWDTVGVGGMTHVTAGVMGVRQVYPPGVWQFEFGGAMILDYKVAISVSGMAEEDGKAAVQIAGWYQDKES